MMSWLYGFDDGGRGSWGCDSDCGRHCNYDFRTRLILSRVLRIVLSILIRLTSPDRKSSCIERFEYKKEILKIDSTHFTRPKIVLLRKLENKKEILNTMARSRCRGAALTLLLLATLVLLAARTVPVESSGVVVSQFKESPRDV